MTLTLGQLRPGAAPAASPPVRESNPASPGADAFGSIMHDTLADRAARASAANAVRQQKADRAATELAPSPADLTTPNSGAAVTAADAAPSVPAPFSAALPWATGAASAAAAAAAAEGASAEPRVDAGLVEPATLDGSALDGAALDAAARLTASTTIPTATGAAAATSIPGNALAAPGTAPGTAPSAATAAASSGTAVSSVTAFANLVTAAPGAAGRATAASARTPTAGSAMSGSAAVATGTDASILPAETPSVTASVGTPATASAATQASATAAPTLPGTALPGTALPGTAQNGAAQAAAQAAAQTGNQPNLTAPVAASTGGAARSAPLESVRLTSTDGAAPTPAAASAGPAGGPAAVPTALPTTLATATPVAAPAPTAAVPLTTQIMKPLFSLTSAAPGEHVLTISVTPDNLGPVTVRAHVSGEGIRMELFAPTDLAREALRAILPDLRRDLAGTGQSAQLDLSSDSQAGDPGATRQRRSDADGRNPNARSPDGRVPDTPLQNRPPRFGSTHTIDVLA